MKNWLLSFAGVVLVAGCAGVGVVQSSDPLAKLNTAETLFMEQDRPLVAEKLIREAIAIYQERDDPHGLGNSHREYADLLRSGSVSGKWENYYRKNGFQDTSVTFENRLTKAKEYYTKALNYYASAERRFQKSERFDMLTNVYYNMANTSFFLEDPVNACKYYERALGAYDESIRRNPSVQPYSPSGTVAELIWKKKRQTGCS